ncbi:hypothetical protein PENTCL1PPCAC_27832, partial [Pristionchus entomophagus]
SLFQHLPIDLNEANVGHLTDLPSGCEINKITIVVEKKTIGNLAKLPELLASIHAKHVEFVLQKIEEYDMLSPFLRDGLPSALVRGGIRHETFS